MSSATDNIKTPTFLIRILELVFNLIATILFMVDTIHTTTGKPKTAVLFGTFIGFIMISIIVITTTILNSPLHRIVLLMIAMCAAFLFFATGGLMFEIWAEFGTVTGYFISSGIFAFLNGFVYLGDFALTFFRIR